MRRLGKGPKPEILVASEVAWTSAYVAAKGTADESKHEKWRHAGIKKSLREETGGKCAYCEGYMEDVMFPNVEHVIPKAVRPDLAHVWSNLTNACSQCNTAKGDFYDAQSGVVDPYSDDPAQHLRFCGAFIDWPLGNLRGEITVKQLKLNRFGLVHERAKRWAQVRDMLERWHEAEGVKKTVLEEVIRLDVREGEYTESIGALLKEVGFPVDAQATSGT